MLKEDDDEWRRWSLSLYGMDTLNCSLYDAVLHINSLTVADVVDVLCDNVVFAKPVGANKAPYQSLL
jgi:cytidylate kinase